MTKVKSNQRSIAFYYKRLPREFYRRETLLVAKELLGQYFVRKVKNKLIIGKIVETEAYIGPFDKASHAYAKKIQSLREKLKVLQKSWLKVKNYLDNPVSFLENILLSQGKLTERNIVEYLRGGHLYIYLIYGNYYQCNITTNGEGIPECVLIRAVEPVKPKNLKTNGPGLFCRAFQLDNRFAAEDLCQSKRIWLSPGKKPSHDKIIAKPRIGIDYAEEHKHLLWRFYIKNNLWVSKK